MRNYINYGEVNRELARRRRQKEEKNFAQRICDILTGVVIGVLVGLAVYMLK